MTIETIPFSDRASGPYTAVVDQTDFTYDFPVFDAEDLDVWRERAGTVTKLVLTTDYSVSGVGQPAGGTVTLTAGAQAGDIIAIDGGLQQQRVTNFVGGTPFRSRTIDDDLNRLTAMVQELYREMSRTIRRIPVDTLSGTLTLPVNVTENTLLALDNLGNVIGLLAADFTGPAGPTGPSGRTILSGSGAPASELGSDGDFYIDTSIQNIYGPKTAGNWGTPTSLIGPSGPGTGDVVGPAGTTDGHAVLFDGTSGKVVRSAGFAPANVSHSHAIANVTGLQAALDAKETLGELAAINSQSGAAYQLVLADKGKSIEMNNAAANTLTVPANTTAAFPVNSMLNIVQMGAGATTIAAAGGVTIRSRNGLVLGGQYAMATLYKRAIDEWIAGGDLSA